MTSNPRDVTALIDDLPALLNNPIGNFSVLAGGAAYCTGIVPHRGYEVIRVRLQTWLPLEQAYRAIERHLSEVGRPVKALCGIEIRVPKPLTRGDWSEFNVPYLDQLRRWGLMFDELSGICRSNIALAEYAPELPSVCAFSFVAPTASDERGFCLSGTADITGDGRIVADGRVDADAMRERTRYTIDVIGTSLKQLGMSWGNVQQVAIFHVHDIPDLWGSDLLGAVGESIRHGLLTYRARPPIAGGEVELEARGARRDYILRV